MADAYQASTRLYDVFTAELLEESAVMGDGSPAMGTNGSRTVDANMDVAIRVKSGQFTWDGAPPTGPEAGASAKGKKAANEAKALAEKLADEADQEERIFKLKDIDFEIPKGKVRFSSFGAVALKPTGNSVCTNDGYYVYSFVQL